MPNASVIDLSAFVEGPYGFSFELNRTTDAPAAGGVTGEVAGVTAKESAGRTAATAAPAPSKRANCRREIEIVFIDFFKAPFGPQLLCHSAIESQPELRAFTAWL